MSKRVKTATCPKCHDITPLSKQPTTRDEIQKVEQQDGTITQEFFSVFDGMRWFCKECGQIRFPIWRKMKWKAGK